MSLLNKTETKIGLVTFFYKKNAFKKIESVQGIFAIPVLKWKGSVAQLADVQTIYS